MGTESAITAEPAVRTETSSLSALPAMDAADHPERDPKHPVTRRPPGGGEGEGPCPQADSRRPNTRWRFESPGVNPEATTVSLRLSLTAPRTLRPRSQHSTHAPLHTRTRGRVCSALSGPAARDNRPQRLPPAQTGRAGRPPAVCTCAAAKGRGGVCEGAGRGAAARASGFDCGAAGLPEWAGGRTSGGGPALTSCVGGGEARIGVGSEERELPEARRVASSRVVRRKWLPGRGAVPL